MRITAKDSIHSAIQMVCEKSTRAGEIVVMLQRDRPDSVVLECLKEFDAKGIYGEDLYEFFNLYCERDISILLKRMTDGRIK